MKKLTLLIVLWTSLNASYTLAEDAASFENNVLTIPRVDTPDKLAQYQNVQFKLAADGRWDLIYAKSYAPALIESLVLKTQENFPIQIYAIVSGNLPNGCYALGRISQRRQGNRLEISVSQIQLQTFAACTQALVPFTEVIPLDVYNLPKGDYEVHINNEVSQFSLSQDNILSLK